MRTTILILTLFFGHAVLADQTIACRILYDKELKKLSYGTFYQPNVKKYSKKGKHRFERPAGPILIADINGNTIEKTQMLRGGQRESTMLKFNPSNCKISKIKYLLDKKETEFSNDYCRQILKTEISQESFMNFRKIIASVPKDLVLETIRVCREHREDLG